MDVLFSAEGLIAFAQIIIIDIVLGGDNAIVIALAAGKLPREQQRKAIVWGTGGAIGIRFVMAAAMIWLLQIPYLHVVGGLLLLWIGVNLLIKKEEPSGTAAAAVREGGLRQAVMTIMLADAVMSLDNVIGVVGIAKGNTLMIVIGMAVSVPIIMYGSQFFIGMIKKYPVILYIGGAVLGWAAGGMLAADPYVPALSDYELPLSAAGVVLIPLTAWLWNRAASHT